MQSRAQTQLLELFKISLFSEATGYAESCSSLPIPTICYSGNGEGIDRQRRSKLWSLAGPQGPWCRRACLRGHVGCHPEGPS